MSDKADGKTDGAGQAGASGGGQTGEPTDPVVLANALRFEKAKNKVLLDEVTALEDEVVNRCMEDFDAVVSDETREFWREQLLTNRDAATAALRRAPGRPGIRMTGRRRSATAHTRSARRSGCRSRWRSGGLKRNRGARLRHADAWLRRGDPHVADRKFG